MEGVKVKKHTSRAPRGWSTVALAVMLLASVAPAACSRNNKDDEAMEPVAPTYLKVENRAFLDMTLYVVRNSQQIRLGLATGNSTTKLLIPASVISSGAALQFLANPIGGRRSPVSQEISVSAGDEVLLIIPPS